MSEFITSSKENDNAYVYAGGDLKEAIERTQEADARQREMYTKRFGGDKDYAAKYMAAKKRRAGGR